MPAPRFSVVVPVYNRSEMVRATIDSVLAQRFDDYELIAVDDGSGDDSVEVLRSYGDRVRVLTQENAGQGAARNHGASVARGEYLALLDSDDVWLPWTLETFHEALVNHGDPDLLLGTRSNFTDEAQIAEIAQAPVRSVRFADFLSLQRARHASTGAGTMVVRREAYLGVGGFDRVRCNSEDVDLFLRLGVAPGCVRLDAPVTLAVRRHDDNSTDVSEKNIAGLEFLLEREASGAYPGGAKRRWDRWNVIAFQARAMSMRLAHEGRLAKALGFYARTAWPHARLGRLRYLAFGAPTILWRWLRSGG